MPRRKQTSILTIALNGRKLGDLERAPNGAISFGYAKDWLAEKDRAIPVSLSLPLREQRYNGASVLSFFDNLLPDNDLIRRKVAERVGAEGTDAFNLLNEIGRDCVGALQFVPEGKKIIAPTPPDYTALSDKDIAEIIRNLATAPLGVRPDGNRELRISIAGAQEKTALLWEKGWALPQGTTPTTHILKPALGKLPNGLDMTRSVENEHFCMTLCQALGLDVAETTIIQPDGLSVLSVKRFDRLKTKDGRLLRLPQEDFCQALSVPPTRKYNNEGGPGIRECLKLLNGSDYAEKDRQIFLKAQIIFWLIGATDGHAKNFSLFLTPGGRYRMTPLYDIMSLQPNFTAKELRHKEFRLAMAVGDNRYYRLDQILPHHFYQDAKAVGMAASHVDEIFESLNSSWEAAFGTALKAMPKPFPQHIFEPIGGAFKAKLEKA